MQATIDAGVLMDLAGNVNSQPAASNVVVYDVSPPETIDLRGHSLAFLGDPMSIRFVLEASPTPLSSQPPDHRPLCPYISPLPPAPQRHVQRDGCVHGGGGPLLQPSPA